MWTLLVFSFCQAGALCSEPSVVVPHLPEYTCLDQQRAVMINTNTVVAVCKLEADQ